MKVRPAALKNEEAEKAREQHVSNYAIAALAGNDVMVLHGHYYYASEPSLSTGAAGSSGTALAVFWS